MSDKAQTIAAFFGHTFLSYEEIDAVPFDFDFSSQTNSDYEHNGSWCVAYHPDVETQTRDTCDLVAGDDELHLIQIEFHGENNRASRFELQLPELDIGADDDEEAEEARVLADVRKTLRKFKISEQDIENTDLGETLTIELEDHGFSELCEYFELDEDMFDEDDPEYSEPDEWFPMMNYAYPLGSGVRGKNSETWHRAMRNTTLVEIEGRTCLALTGGGMDMSWYIAEAYLRAGYLPPVHFANLPEMAGNGKSEKDRMIMEACMLSLEAMRDRMTNKMEELAKHMARTEAKAS